MALAREQGVANQAPDCHSLPLRPPPLFISWPIALQGCARPRDLRMTSMLPLSCQMALPSFPSSLLPSLPLSLPRGNRACNCPVPCRISPSLFLLPGSLVHHIPLHRPQSVRLNECCARLSGPRTYEEEDAQDMHRGTIYHTTRIDLLVSPAPPPPPPSSSTTSQSSSTPSCCIGVSSQCKVCDAMRASSHEQNQMLKGGARPQRICCLWPECVGSGRLSMDRRE